MEYQYFLTRKEIPKKLYLWLLLISFFSFSTITSQTLNYTIDTATGFGDDTITETLTNAGNTYVLTVFHEGGVGSNIQNDTGKFYLSAEGTGGDYIVSVTKNGNPVHFTLNSIVYDTLEDGDVSLKNQSGAIIANQATYSVGSGAITISNAANATEISSFNITSHNTLTTGGFNDFAFHDINITIVSSITWTGATNNNWETNSNWSINSAPLAGSDVTIPNGLTNYPIVSATAANSNTITVESGAVIKQTGTINGAITFKRNLATNKWYLISSPVNGETIENFRTNNTFATGSVAGRIGLAPYDNTKATPGTRWAYQTTTSTGSISSGEGYSVKLASSADLTFTGNAITTNPITKGIAIGAGNAFNLVGNPYLSYYDTNAFLTNNSALLTSQTIWLWNQATNSYDTKVAADNFKIAPAQGFFIECGTAGNVEFDQSDQSLIGNTFQRGSSKPEIYLSISSNKGVSKTKFYFIEGTTKGFDNGYDGKMFNGVSNNFAVYSQLVSENKGINYAIQSLPLAEIEQVAIPIGLNAEAGAEILFSSSSLSLPNNTKIYLEDRINNEFIDITEKNHSVTLDKKYNGIGQYYLRASSKNLSSLNPIANSINDVSIFNSSDNKISIVGLQTEKANIKAFSLSGKQVLNKVFNSNGYSEIETPKLATGIYIIELTSNLGKTTKKIILK